MRVTIIGAGRVGAALGTRLSAAGHEVLYGVRDPADPRYGGMQVDGVTAAVERADVVVLAVPWRAVRDVVEELGDVGDRIIVDATNPFADDRSHIRHPELSATERIREWLTGGRLVKAFNTTGSGNLADPTYPSGVPVMFVAGEEAEARRTTMALARDLGFEAIDAGGIVATRDLEHLAVLWVRLAYGLGHGPNIAFSLLRR